MRRSASSVPHGGFTGRLECLRGLAIIQYAQLPAAAAAAATGWNTYDLTSIVCTRSVQPVLPCAKSTVRMVLGRAISLSLSSAVEREASIVVDPTNRLISIWRYETVAVLRRCTSGLPGDCNTRTAHRLGLVLHFCLQVRRRRSWWLLLGHSRDTTQGTSPYRTRPMGREETACLQAQLHAAR